MVFDGDIADSRQLAEGRFRYGASKAQLHLVMREVAQTVDGSDLDQAALANDRDAVAGALDLAQDVARKEDGPAFRLRLPHQRVERLLDERIESGRPLVEPEQFPSMLEGGDQPHLRPLALRQFPAL